MLPPDEDPTLPPTEPLPALQAEVIPPTAYDVLLAMHDNVVQSFLQEQAADLDFPSMWRLAKHLTKDRPEPIVVYRFRRGA